MSIQFENIHSGQPLQNDGVLYAAEKSATEDGNITHSYSDERNEQQAGEEFKPLLQRGRSMGPDDYDAAANDLENQKAGAGDTDYEVAKARFLAVRDQVPPDLLPEWEGVLMVLEGLDGLGEGIPKDLESFMTLILALLVLLVEVSSEMKKSQRDASFASMKLSVGHMVNQAEHIKSGALDKMIGAAVGGAVTILGNLGGLGFVARYATGNNIHEITMRAQMGAQIGSSAGGVITNVGEFAQAQDSAAGTIEQSESQKDNYDSEQFKDTGNTTRELISSALNNIKELINAYRSALDHAAGNMA